MSEQLQKAEQANETTSIGQKINKVIYRAGIITAKTALGVGVGAATGIGAIVAIASAEVTLPALLVLKTFSFAGGAMGFLTGLKK